MDLAVLIRQLQGMLGGRSIRFGSGSVTFTANADSAQTAVPHGLPAGTTPTGVFLTYKNPGAGKVAFRESAAPDATNIYVSGFQTQATAITATVNFYWLAIG